MGRLFWKLFLILWLTQITTAVGVGIAFSLRRQHEAAAPTERTAHHDAALLDTAQITLRQGGVPALRTLLTAWREAPWPALYVLDDQGRELLGRQPVLRAVPAARWAETADGQRYQLLLAPDNGDFHGPGGGPPPNRSPVPPEPLVVGLVASLIFGALLARYLSKPIRLMRGAFDSVAEGNLKVNLAAQLGRRQDELADLGRDFDLVAQRLQGLIDDKKRLLHDVSHELRSPLARLSAAVDLARQQPEKLETWLERMEREAGRMDKLVGELLAIARLDAEGTGGGETLDLRDFLGALAADAQFEAGLRGCRVELDVTDDCRIAGRPELLRRAVENVLRNAVRYSPPGGVVQIRSALQPDGRVRIEIHDHGPGVPEAELETIFEPFFRSGNGDNQGYGLGLAIAKRVIDGCGGRIAARNAAEGGLTVTIELPVVG